MMNVNKPKKYLWVRGARDPNTKSDFGTDASMIIIENPLTLFSANLFDAKIDKLYELGDELKFKVDLIPINSVETVYRDPFKGGESVRFYRGDNI